MANRSFKLPNIGDLSKEQDAALELPKDGQHLIVGGPGTGKTVMALLRARRYHREKDDYVFLVWNHLLRQASVQLAAWPLKIDTWERWFGRLFKHLTDRQLPRIDNVSNGYSQIDWNAVLNDIQEVRQVSRRPYLVIDEGQDMPPKFYRALVDLGFEQFYVVADQNQQITEVNSSRKDIEDSLGIDSKDVVELRKNYRNSTPVAKLARSFYTGDRASPPPEVPDRPGDPPLLVTYSPDHIDEICRNIVLRVDRDPGKLIGVIAPNNDVRESFLDCFESTDPDTLDHGLPRIDTTFSGDRSKIRFDRGGLIVINAQNCKGLEFDDVIMADVDQHVLWQSDPDRTKKLFYVMSARALAGNRHSLFLLKRSGPDGKWLDGFLPDDPEILKVNGA